MLLYTLFIVFLFANEGSCIPVGPLKNVTTHREQKVMFPPDPIRNPIEWSRFSSSNASRATAFDHDTPFIFPDDLPTLTPPARFIPVILKRSPKCAEGSTFCEEIEEYPANYLEKVLTNKVDEYQAILGTDELKESGIQHKIDGVDENPLCASMEQIVYPKTAKTKEDKWLYVVNQPPFTQGVRIEKCLKNGESGSNSCAFTDQFPLGYKTSCKQKYIFRKLVALDESGKTITDTFQLPSCCACTVKAESLRSRLGGMRNPTTPAVPNANKPKTDSRKR